MLKKTTMLLLGAMAIGLSTMAQEAVEASDSGVGVAKSIFNPKYNRFKSNKGKFFAHWGYNFSSYAKSDIRFQGPGYDFTLKGVKASDRPTKLGWTYVNPARITVPQFNLHFGYFIKDNYSISLGWDHMKYVVDMPQTVQFVGHADKIVSEPGVPSGIFGDAKDGDYLALDEGDLHFEHTDGYNFATVGIERYDDIWVSQSRKQSVNSEFGLEGGLLIPRSDVRLFGLGENHYWNIAGYGFAAKAGVQYHFLKWMYLQGSFKTGFTDLNKIRTTGRNNLDKASQTIWFFENYWVLGFRF
ncbi:hypothetical protein [Sphingobacterium tabacisoli]|uniref:Outermembrane protein n=2 Tax=Sphingobacterium tabacisoli TaxID=2044855 RepID=A0ABW5L627_9SPHI|nr:hypothetical protein [Sphingobacterium tabacisoli]